MPELPEVETLRRELLRVLVNKKITKIEVHELKTIIPLSKQKLNTATKGRIIIALHRRAKILIIDLDNQNHILIHLKMTGQLIYRPQIGKMVVGGHPQPGGLDNLPNKFTRVVINFSDRSSLYFNDMRKFGWLRYLPNHEKESTLEKIGPEPLTKAFTVSFLLAILKKYPKRNIKQLLLDQTIIAGLGNIYVDESLFASGINPNKKAGEITKKETAKLHQAIKNILKLSIKKKGTSFRDYRRSDGQRGGFVPYLKVYGRAGQPCLTCSQPIKKIRLAGRGTHFCLKCQK